MPRDAPILIKGGSIWVFSVYPLRLMGFDKGTFRYGLEGADIRAAYVDVLDENQPVRFNPDREEAGDRALEVRLKRAGSDNKGSDDKQSGIREAAPDDEERAQTFLGAIGDGPNLSATITKKDGLVISTLGLPLILNFVPGVARPYRYKYLSNLGKVVFRSWRIGGRGDAPAGGDAATFIIGVEHKDFKDVVDP